MGKTDQRLKPGDVLTFMPGRVSHVSSRVMICVVVGEVHREADREVLDVLMLEDSMESSPHAFSPGMIVSWPRSYLEGDDWARFTDRD